MALHLSIYAHQILSPVYLDVRGSGMSEDLRTEDSITIKAPIAKWRDGISVPLRLASSASDRGQPRGRMARNPSRSSHRFSRPAASRS